MKLNSLKHSIAVMLSIGLANIGSFAFAAPLFEDGFESNALKTVTNSIRWDSSSFAQLSSEHVKTGAYSLMFTYIATDDKTDSWAEQRFSLGKQYRELWISYDVRIPENYYHREVSYGSSNNKGFIMLWAGEYEKPLGPKIGTEFWPEKDGSSKASIRLSGAGFDKHFWEACPKIVNLSDRGQWIKITVHFKNATSGRNDGIFRLWKTYSTGKSELVCNISDGEWYVPGVEGMDKGYLMGWSNSGYKEETRFYIDNFKVSVEPLLDVLDPPIDTKLQAVE